MAKKQPRKAVKLESLKASVNQESIAKSVRKLVKSHSGLTGTLIQLSEAVQVVINKQSDNLFMIVKTLLLGIKTPIKNGEIIFSGGLVHILNDPDLSNEQKSTMVTNVVDDVYTNWIASLKAEAVKDGIAESKYTNKAERVRNPINVLAHTLIHGSQEQIQRVKDLATNSKLQDVLELASDLEVEFIRVSSGLGGVYRDKETGKDVQWSQEGLLEDMASMDKAELIYRNLMNEGGLQVRHSRSLAKARIEWRKQELSTLITDNRTTKAVKTKKVMNNDATSENLGNVRMSLNAIMSEVEVA